MLVLCSSFTISLISIIFDRSLEWWTLQNFPSCHHWGESLNQKITSSLITRSHIAWQLIGWCKTAETVIKSSSRESESEVSSQKMSFSSSLQTQKNCHLRITQMRLMAQQTTSHPLGHTGPPTQIWKPQIWSLDGRRSFTKNSKQI